MTAIKTTLAMVAALIVVGCAGGMDKGKMAMPFGGEDSVKYAKHLWAAMEDANLIGEGMIMSTPYKGQHPHGAVLETVDTTIKVKGHRGAIIVKRNYGGEGVSNQAVANDPQKYLKAVTVMYKREAGYDSDNKDWFWVKYLANGDLDMNPKKMKLAGRVAKGMPKGCIACHKAAPGGDYVFNNDRIGG